MVEVGDQIQLPPRERVVTLPAGVPELTLGYGVLAWIEQNLVQPNGPLAGRPFRPTLSQARFILWFYAVDERGRWLFNRAARRLAKGSGKTPMAAVLGLAELLGPVRVAEFDDRVPGGVVGMPVVMPLVRVAATSEQQTGNTMRMIRAMANKRSVLAKKYELDVGKTFIETPAGGKLEQITSSASSAEGAEQSFTVADEVEHWTPGNGGVDLVDTLVQNSAKTNARIMETCNAWLPGAESVAEKTFNAWCDQEEGKTIGRQKILYDALIAPANTSLTDHPSEGEISISEALKFVYQDCPWIDVETIKEQIWSPAYPVSRSRRFFLNQPNAAEDAWCTLQEWSVLADPDRALVDGEDVVLFFDGSKSNDHTALVGCCMSDGHVFTVGVWAPRKDSGVVDVGAVDSAVKRTFDRFNVVGFHADVREWESYVKDKWPKEYGDQIVVWAQAHGIAASPIAWDMRSHVFEFGAAAEMCLAEIQDGAFTHDGNWETSKHVGNCRRADSRGHITVKKESPKSPNKIDAAVCVIGARMVYHKVLGSKEWEAYKGDNGEWVVY